MDHPKLEEWKAVWRERRSVTMVYILLRISVVLVMLAQIFNGNFENVFLCVLTLILFMMPSVLEKKLDITLPNTLEIIILLFIYAAEIMGEIGAYYVTFPYWDTVLHTLNGFLCAAIGFSLLDILNRHSEARFHLSPLYLAIVAFCFSMTVGVIWEFFECTMDQLFFLDMQKDTVVNTIGSIMLDPTGGNTSTVLKNNHRRHHRAGGRHPDRTGAGRVSGHWSAGHDGGSVRQLHRCADVLDHRLLLRVQPRRKQVCQTVHPSSQQQHPPEGCIVRSARKKRN